MKIPESVRIGGIEYKIEYVENLRQGNELLYGLIDYDNCKIFLSLTDGKGHEKKCVTLLHEILHGIIYHAVGEIEDEENVVTMLAKGLYQVLQDNGRRLFDIVPEEARRK